MTPREDGRSPFVVAWSDQGMPFAWLVWARSALAAERLVHGRRGRRVTARAATSQDMERLEWLFPSDRQAGGRDV